MPAGRMALGNGNPAAVSVTERAGCRTVVGVAHEDDDLLFISPRVTQLVKRKCPVQVVYLTAGNDGRPAGLASFAARRETGAQRAYARMVPAAENWALAPLQLGPDRIPSYTPRSGGGDIRLTFLRLPDGLPMGDGSVLNRHQSLLRLFRGENTSMDAVDSSRSYDEKRLVATLSWIMEQWQADEVLTLDYDNVKFGGPSKKEADHSDHGISARYFRSAAYALRARPRISPYLGYLISSLPANLDAGQRRAKSTALVAYVDTAKCSPLRCPRPESVIDTYRNWLAREYRRRHRAPKAGEIVSDIGRARAHEATELCLDARAASAVSTRPCDGSLPQTWEFTPDRTIRSTGVRKCLTSGPGVGLATCSGRKEQVWRRDGKGLLKAAGGCLTQDDMARAAPRLRMSACDPYRPEVVWRW
ncbi:ricin-type beta-trefoil lectin domain protein [Streptomyces anulatus]